MYQHVITQLPIILFSQKLIIDFLSLDVEGSELDILTTVPWQNVDIRWHNVWLTDWHIALGDYQPSIKQFDNKTN